MGLRRAHALQQVTRGVGRGGPQAGSDGEVLPRAAVPDGRQGGCLGPQTQRRDPHRLLTRCAQRHTNGHDLRRERPHSERDERARHSDLGAEHSATGVDDCDGGQAPQLN